MNDLTTGSLAKNVLKMSSFMLVSMVFQTLYFLVDLYFVGRLGKDAVAAVSVSGNLTFLVLAATQTLGVGTTSLIAQAVGRKDHATARLVFNQSQVLSVVAGALFFVALLALRDTYTSGLAADAQTAALANDYLTWFIPAMALQFVLVRNHGRAARHRQLQARDVHPIGHGAAEHLAGPGADLRLGHRPARWGWRAPRWHRSSPSPPACWR